MTAQTILPANSVTGGFEVANSAMFDGTSAYMHKTPDSGPSSADLFTISVWVKRCAIGSSNRQVIFDAREDAENFDRISINSDVLEWKGIRSDSQAFNLTTSRVFRDPSAWYHLHFIWDSADGTANNRMRIYVNGVQETSFGTRANPSSGLNAIIGANGEVNSVGSGARSGDFWDGYMAEFVYLDGQELTPDGNTGEFEEDSGIWKPKNVSGLTFGTNGFYLDFQASGNLGNDANGGTDLTEVGFAAADQSTDTCTNNFATWNPLRKHLAFTATFTEGNTTVEHGQADQNQTAFSTMAVSTGKWYAEFQCSTNASNFAFGIARINTTNDGGLDSYPGSLGGMHYAKNGEIQWYAGGDANSDTGTTFAHTDIIGVLFDLDNTRLYFYKNDTLVNSGGIDYSVGTAVDGSTSETTYYFAAGSSDGGTNPVLQANFGGSSGFAISSAQSDPDGYGNFEFATKGGYALCTKNLAEYG